MSGNELQAFDSSVERYLSHQMSIEEEIAFKKLLRNSNELRGRAATIALAIKMMGELAASRDSRIIYKLKNMNEDAFRQITCGRA